MKSRRSPGKTSRFPALVLGLSLAASLWALRTTPFNRVLENPWGDALDHFSMIQAASQALGQGQFPPREIPRVSLRLPPVFERYGVFQFYSNFPLTLAGGLAFLGLNPWHAFWLVTLLAFLAGFLGIFRLGRELGLGEEASAAAGLFYTLAPYHLALLSYRGALPELCVLGLLPWIFLFSFQAARDPGWKAVALSGLAWAALMHTHHVFHAWTLPFFLSFLLLWRYLKAGAGFKLWKAMLGYLLGLALSLWFVLPGALVGRHFLGLASAPAMAAGAGDALYTLKTLLAHSWLNSWLGLEGRGYHVYHMGWPILAGVLAFLIRRRKQSFREPLLWLFLAAFCLTWGAVFYWKLLGPLQMMQTKFRLLTYICLFGSLAAGLSLDRLPAFKARMAVLLLFLATCALHLPYQQASALPFSLDELARAQQDRGVELHHQPYPYVIPEAEAEAMGEPDLALQASRPLQSRELEPGLEALSPSGFPRAAVEAGTWTRVRFTGVAEGTLALLPAAWYPGLYIMEVNGQRAAYGRVGNRLAAALPRGDVILRYRFAGSSLANGISLAAWAGLLIAILAFLAASWLKKRKRPLSRPRRLGLFLVFLALAALARGQNAAFDYPYAGGEMASNLLDFAEAGRCFQLALDSASTDGELALALAQVAGARMNQGELKGVGPLVKRALAAAERCGEQKPLMHAYIQAAEYALRQGRLEDAGQANDRAFKESLRAPLDSYKLRDRPFFQAAAILAAQGKPRQAEAFLEKTWMTWAYRPDYLYGTSMENLSRAVLAYLDLRRLNDRVFPFAVIYADSTHLVRADCPNRWLKAEWAIAQICQKHHRLKTARIFYVHAAKRHLALYGPDDPETRRLKRLASLPLEEGRP